MTKEPRWIIRNAQGQFLAHRGHEHYWTRDRSDAMEYTKREVAQPLADKYRGALEIL